jgi:outer membrane immunogenic protein
MKKLFLTTVSVLALSRAALAADLETKAPRYQAPPPAYWTGSYLGIQGGFVRQDGSFDLVDANSFFALGPHNESKLGGTVGGVLGYNWQLGNFVYGLEGDWNWLGGKATTDGVISRTSFGVDWLATARGRAGLAVDATLLYFTGGLAFGHAKDTVTGFNSVNGVPFDSFSQNATKVGWTVGAGIEQKLSTNWSAKAEFRYVDLGSSTVSCTSGTNNCAGSGYRGEFSNRLMMGLVGLNYKF